MLTALILLTAALLTALAIIYALLRNLKRQATAALPTDAAPAAEPGAEQAIPLWSRIDDTELSIEERAKRTCAYMQQLVSDIGCTPEDCTADSFSFKYQGEVFLVNCGPRTCMLIDPCWLGIKALSFNDLGLIRKAVTAANTQRVMTIMMHPTEDNEWVLSTWHEMMIHPANGENEMYLRETLRRFFDTKHILKSAIDTLRPNYELALFN